MALADNISEERFEGVGGLNIFVRSWRPDGTVRGVVVIVPGFNSHSGYYLWVADQLVAGGLAVYALDLRGRGKSKQLTVAYAKQLQFISNDLGSERFAMLPETRYAKSGDVSPIRSLGTAQSTWCSCRDLSRMSTMSGMSHAGPAFWSVSRRSPV